MQPLVFSKSNCLYRTQVGVRSARLIVASHRFSKVGLYQLKKMGVVMKKAQYWKYLEGETEVIYMIMDKDIFRQEIYSVVAAIPWGRVLTYGQVAYLAGSPRYARMVGRVMHDVPTGSHLPCHRVVNSQGKPAPFWAEQRKLLEAEGVIFKKNGCVDMKKSQWRFIDE